MCTLSWTALSDGYLLYFNRDERRSREAAWAPRIASNRPGGPQHVAAIDAEAGGTWMGVNEFGLSLAILNRYGAEAKVGEAKVGEAKIGEAAVAQAAVAQAAVAGERRAGKMLAEPRLGPTKLTDLAATGAFTSRGILVRELLDAADLTRLGQMLGEALNSRRFRPFDLVAFAPSAAEDATAAARADAWLATSGLRPASPLACLRYTWDGADLVCDAAPQAPISSSAFDTVAVLEGRRRRYAATVGDAASEAGLDSFHRSHLPARGAYSVCMHRPDAATRSLSQIRVDAQQVLMRYGPGPACRAQLGEPVVLARRPAHV